MASQSETNISSVHIMSVLLLIMGVLYVSQSRDMQTAHGWVVIAARYIVYLLVSRGLIETCEVIFRTKKIVVDQYKQTFIVFTIAAAILLTSRQPVLGEEFPTFFTAFIICQYLSMFSCAPWNCCGAVERKQKPTINYGTGMACSFFEGYFSHIIPSDGARFKHFVDKIRTLEDIQGVAFPVKKLLLVVTKSLFCPPDLKQFNKPDCHHLPQIEACSTLEVVKKDVAGVKNRKYHNTAYKLWFPDGSRRPVYIIAECATPLHTLYGVLQKRNLYQGCELCDVDVKELVHDFCTQLETVISRSPDCRGRCELVYFDDTAGSGEYLPTVLLNKIAELEPDYEQIIARHDAEHAPIDIPADQLFVHAPPKVLTPTI